MVDRILSFVVFAAATLAAFHKWAFAGIGLAALGPWQLALAGGTAVTVGLAAALYDRLLETTVGRAAAFVILNGLLALLVGGAFAYGIEGMGLMGHDNAFVVGVCLYGIGTVGYVMHRIQSKFGPLLA